MVYGISPGIRRVMMMAVALVAVVVALFAFSASAQAVDLVVNDDGVGTTCSFPGTAGFATIGAAVAAAAPSGDTIKVCNGDYLEAVNLGTKYLTIEGESMTGVKIYTTPAADYGLQGSGDPAAASADTVTLKNFTLIGPNNEPVNSSHYGIKLYTTKLNAVIENVVVRNSNRSNLDFNGMPSVSLKNVDAYDAVRGVGIAFSDVGTILVEDITTSGNTWGGVAIYTKRSGYPTAAATTSVEFKAPLALGEEVPLMVEMDINGGNYYGVGNIDLNNLLPYMVTAFRADVSSSMFAFAANPAAADALVTRFKRAYGSASTPTQVTFDANDLIDVVAKGESIAAAISTAAAGDTVAVGVGLFAENVVVDKHIRLVGLGSGADPAKNTVIKNPGIEVVAVNASGVSGDPILLKNFRVEPVNQTGIHFPESSASNYVTIDGVKVIGSGVATGEVEFCFYVKPSAAITWLTVENSAFEQCELGFTVSRAPGGGSQCNDPGYNPTFNQIVVKNSSIRDNGNKGLYIEKVNDALFENLAIANNGLRIAGSNPNFNAGFDINLKCNAYANLTLKNLAVVRNGLGFKEGMGLGIKARADAGSYNTNPATLTNVQVIGGVYIGNERGIRIGEPNKTDNSGPAVSISGAAIYGNVSTYPGLDGSLYGDLVNWVSTGPVTRSGNWYGTGGAVVVSAPLASAIGADATPAAAPLPAVTLSIPSFTSYRPLAGSQPTPANMLDVPLEITPFAAHVTSLQAKINHPACLVFDSLVNPQPALTYIPTASSGSLELAMHPTAGGPPPYVNPLQGSTAIVMRFVASACADGPLAFTFAASPAVICGDAAGQDVPCTATGGTVTFEVDVTPSDIKVAGLTTVPFNEGQAPPASVGALSSTDPDGFAPIVYSLEANAACPNATNQSFFTVSDNVLHALKKFDYETMPTTYYVCVKAEDQRGGVAYREIQINIGDVVETGAALSVGQDPTYFNVVREGSSTALNIPIQFTANSYTPTSLSFKLTYGIACLDFDGTTTPAGFVSESPAGTLNFYFNAPPAGPGPLTTLKFLGLACPGLRTNVALDLNNVVAVDGIQPVPVTETDNTAIVIENSPRGDCNANGLVNAADLSAGVLEYWDVPDGSHITGGWLQAPYSFFAGSPYGCDANGDKVDGVSDITCTVLGIFGGTCLTSAPTAASLTPATLGVPAVANGNVTVTFRSSGHQVAAIGFTLKLDPALAFDATDADGDGLPDAVTVNLAGSPLKMAVYDAADHSLKVVVMTGMVAPLAPLADGPIVTVAVQGAGAAGLAELSAGGTEGYNVPVEPRVEDAPANVISIYLPAISR